jgi:serine/threonine protein kinase
MIREVLTTNLIVAGMVLVLIIFVAIKFSSLPTLSEAWKKRIRKITYVSLYWSVIRIIREVLILLMDAFDYSISDEITSDQDTDVTTLCGYFIITLISEVFCVFFVQDYEFIEIFMSFEEEDVEGLLLVPVERRNTMKPGKRNNRFTMVQENPFKDEEDLQIIESFNIQPNKLGKTYKASFNDSIVFYRRIAYPRLSTYICEEFISEIDSYKEILTENIIPVLGIVLKEPVVGFISPYFANGSLYKHLHILKTKFSLRDKISMAITISEALEEVHSIPRAHGHLSSHNILFDAKMSPNISDLGFYKVKKYAGLMLEYTNLSGWSSPEIIKDKRVTPMRAKPSDDSYSFGMILWEMVAEKPPFDGMNKEELYKIVVTDGSRPSIEGVPTDIAEIIYKCWNPDPEKRPIFIDITEMLEQIQAE